MSRESDEEARILAAARALGRGGARFTMHELARASGMSRATLYRRVRDRERLAARLQEHGVGTPPPSRERALTAARALLVEVGVEALTVEAIAARAGLSVATLYREFGDRAALLRATFRSVVPIDVLRPLLADHARPPEEVLPKFIAAMLGHLRAQPTMLRVMTMRGAPEIARLRRLRRAEEGLSSAVLGYLAAQIERGRLRPCAPRRLATSLIGLVFGAHVFPALLPEGEAAPEEDLSAVAEELVSMFLRGAGIDGARRRMR